MASSFGASSFTNHNEWQNALKQSEVRLQWDPHHDPDSKTNQRRAIQIGIRGEYLKRFGNEESIKIKDISEFVARERANINNLNELEIPIEHPYKHSLTTI